MLTEKYNFRISDTMAILLVMQMQTSCKCRLTLGMESSVHNSLKLFTFMDRFSVWSKTEGIV